MANHFFKNLFSVTNRAINNKKHKVITILGIKIKCRIRTEEIKPVNIKKEIYDNETIYKEKVECLLKNYKNFDYNTDKIKIYLLNDTRRSKMHLGCNAVVSNIEKLANKNNMEIIFYDSCYQQNNFYDEGWGNVISKADAVIVNGEGTLHDNRALSIFKKCQIAHNYNIPCFLINSLWQNMNEMEHYLELFDIISVRESKSYDALPENMKHKARIVPDISLYGTPFEKSENAKDQLIFVDSVSAEKTNIIKQTSLKYNAPMYYMSSSDAKNYLTEDVFSNLTNNSLIITGRFHAMTLAIKNKIPFYVFSSNSHKVEGLLKDIDMENLLINKENVESRINQPYPDLHFVEKCQKYHDFANIEAEKLFRDIYQRSKHRLEIIPANGRDMLINRNIEE